MREPSLVAVGCFTTGDVLGKTATLGRALGAFNATGVSRSPGSNEGEPAGK